MTLHQGPPAPSPACAVLPYTTPGLDRAHHIRRDPAVVAAVWDDARRVVLPVWRNRHAFDPRTLAPLGLDEGCGVEDTVFLGLLDGAPWFAVDVSPLDAPPALIAPGGEPARWEDLRALGPAIPAREATALAAARGLLAWHRRHGFCGVCGAQTRRAEAGHLRVCTNPACGERHFPRLDPVVIMLVTDPDDRVLLGRAPRMPPGMLTVLAGFVEHGETLEQAVVREVAEEAGVEIDPASVRYRVSQPWPFPASLMVAFTARARPEATAITVDPAELESARWATRGDVATFRETTDPGSPNPQDTPALPRADSVARWLLDGWLSGSF